MKVLVSTSKTQKQRKNDFCFCNEGELVMFGSECDGEPVDGNCGCKRAMAGLDSNAGTTTFMVADLNITKTDFIDKMRDSLLKAGWFKSMPADELTELITKDVENLVSIAAGFPVNTILERREKFQVRTAS